MNFWKENEMEVKGYKVFNPDWTCLDKKYTCPGTFRENCDLEVCGQGMHFCKQASNCFNYYSFNHKNHVAEVIARGTVKEDGDKCCTDYLEIVREIPWAELLTIVNTGKNCTGYCNSGDRNSGDYNSGNYNSGNFNSGYRDSGNCNSGDFNSGYRNSGNYNSGNYNSGNWNSGNCNSGNYNSGDCNSGYFNSGNYNSGNCNSGNFNSGYRNSGNYNSGNYNSGNYNSGNWNKSSFNTGCFNTEEEKIRLFNKPSSWTYRDWFNSRACYLLNQIPKNVVKWVCSENMTDEEKAKYPSHETARGYLKVLDEPDCAALWWGTLDDADKQTIMSIPNFDKAVFKEITGETPLQYRHNNLQ